MVLSAATSSVFSSDPSLFDAANDSLTSTSITDGSTPKASPKVRKSPSANPSASGVGSVINPA